MEQLTLFDEGGEAEKPRGRYHAPGLPARARRILKTEGLYNYALLIKEAEAYSGEYVSRTFGMPKSELVFILINEFNQAVGYQETYTEFLANVKNIPSYGLQQIK